LLRAGLTSFAKTVGQTDASADNNCHQINDKNAKLKKKLMVLETLHSDFVASAKSVIDQIATCHVSLKIFTIVANSGRVSKKLKLKNQIKKN
jgi:hypothetical protein